MSTAAPHDPLARELFEQIAAWPIFDPHSHIDATSPAARDLDEVLGYHYYTELAHSAGMPAGEGRPGARPPRAGPEPGRAPPPDRQHGPVLLAPGDRPDLPRLPARPDRPATRSTTSTAGPTTPTTAPSWDAKVWERTNLEAVFLTNEFDDPLDGWDTSKYVPCLRTDDLVLKLHEPRTLQRLMASTNVDVGDVKSLRMALASLFEYFVGRGARACRHQPAARLPAEAGDAGRGPRRRSGGP